MLADHEQEQRLRQDGLTLYHKPGGGFSYRFAGKGTFGRGLMRARRLRRGLSLIVRGFVLVLLLSAEGSAQIPETITYQGHLTGQGGGPVSGTLAMTFAIYTAKTGGSALWTETHPAVPVDNGQFSVELGSVTPFDSVPLTFDVPYFLGTTVGADTEMQPRRPFTSVGYALNSVHA